MFEFTFENRETLLSKFIELIPGEHEIARNTFDNSFVIFYPDTHSGYMLNCEKENAIEMVAFFKKAGMDKAIVYHYPLEKFSNVDEMFLHLGGLINYLGDRLDEEMVKQAWKIPK